MSRSGSAEPSADASGATRRRAAERLGSWLLHGLLPALLALLVLGHAGGRWTLAPLQHLDGWLHDVRLRLFAPSVPDPRIAVVAIDESSMASLGRWPWSRDRLADLVNGLFEQHDAVLVGLDMILAEPDHSSGLAALEAMARGPLARLPGFEQALAARRPQLDHDGRLEQVLKQHPVVLGFHLSRGAGAQRLGQLPPSLLPPEGLEGLPVFHGFGGNLARLQSAAVGAGFVNADVDPDGVRRRTPLLARVDGQVQPALALALARAVLGSGTVTLHQGSATPDAGPDLLRLQGPAGRLDVAIGPGAQVLLPFARAEGLAPVYPAADVLAGRIPADALRGRIVLVGATASGLADLHATPVATHLPGVQAHASLLAAILDQRVPRVPSWAPGWVAALVLLVIGCMVAMKRLPLRSATGLAAAVALLMVASDAAAWAVWDEGLPLAGPLLLLALAFGWHVFVGHFVESRDRRRLADLFGQYVPPELVDRMSRDPARYGMQGRSAELSVMFADLRGFTTLSEALPPDELAALMNEFLSEMTDIVRAHGGTLDKYVGDAIMAFWGAPLPDPQHARHAVEAALAMQAALPGLNERFARRGWPSLALGIGINSGTMVVGDLGSRHRRAYTVLGDAVNVAARLQELSAVSPLGIVLGSGTQAALGGQACRALQTVSLRGRKAPETLFVPLLDARGRLETAPNPIS